MKKQRVTKKKPAASPARGSTVQADPVPQASASTRTNTLQRHGQTVTVCFNDRRPGPSVKMLFEDADLEVLNRAPTDDQP